MTFDFLIYFIVSFAFGYFIGEFITVMRLRKSIRQLALDLGVNIEKEMSNAAKSIPKLVTEVHNDIIYLYDLESASFICQANSMEELAKTAMNNKNILTAVVKHGDSWFAFKDGYAHNL